MADSERDYRRGVDLILKHAIMEDVLQLDLPEMESDLRRGITLLEGVAAPLKSGGRLAACHFFLGKAHQRLGDAAESLTHFVAGIEAWPDHPQRSDFFNEIGGILVDQGEFETALRANEEALRAESTLALRANRALILLLLGRLGEAEGEIGAVLEADGDDRMSRAIAAIVAAVSRGEREQPKTALEVDALAKELGFS